MGNGTLTGHYDQRPLVSPDLLPILRVWDESSKKGYTGPDRWLCEDSAGTLWLYSHERDYWYDANTSPWCIDLRNNYSPVWSFGDHMGSEEVAVSADDNVARYIVMLKDSLGSIT
jgi:hypothetical protein